MTNKYNGQSIHAAAGKAVLVAPTSPTSIGKQAAELGHNEAVLFKNFRTKSIKGQLKANGWTRTDQPVVPGERVAQYIHEDGRIGYIVNWTFAAAAKAGVENIRCFFVPAVRRTRKATTATRATRPVAQAVQVEKWTPKGRTTVANSTRRRIKA